MKKRAVLWAIAQLRIAENRLLTDRNSLTKWDLERILRSVRKVLISPYWE